MKTELKKRWKYVIGIDGVMCYFCDTLEQLEDYVIELRKDFVSISVIEIYELGKIGVLPDTKITFI